MNETDNNDFYPKCFQKIQSEFKTKKCTNSSDLNPPYSIGQRSANDNAQNQAYLIGKPNS